MKDCLKQEVHMEVLLYYVQDYIKKYVKTHISTIQQDIYVSMKAGSASVCILQYIII
jgi:hypothetical protein